MSSAMYTLFPTSAQEVIQRYQLAVHLLTVHQAAYHRNEPVHCMTQHNFVYTQTYYQHIVMKRSRFHSQIYVFTE